MLQDSTDELQKSQFMASASAPRSPAPEAAPFSPSPMVLSCVCVCVCVCVCLCVCVCVCVCVYVFPSLLPVGSCPLQLVWFCLVLQRKTCRNNLRLCISDRRILLTQLEKTLLVIGLESLWCCVFFLGHLYC